MKCSRKTSDDPAKCITNLRVVQYRISIRNLSFTQISLRPRQNVGRFADDTFKRIFLNENVRISIKISFVPMFRINNIPPLVQIMAWRRLGDKPLSEPMMVSLLTHICVTRPQWVKVGDFSQRFWPRWLHYKMISQNVAALPTTQCVISCCTGTRYIMFSSIPVSASTQIRWKEWTSMALWLATG